MKNIKINFSVILIISLAAMIVGVFCNLKTGYEYANIKKEISISKFWTPIMNKDVLHMASYDLEKDETIFKFRERKGERAGEYVFKGKDIISMKTNYEKDGILTSYIDQTGRGFPDLIEKKDNNSKYLLDRIEIKSCEIR